MPKIVTRIVAWLLIPSLLANPSFALVLESGALCGSSPTFRFPSEAIIGRIVTAVFPGNNPPAGHGMVHRFLKPLWEEALAGGGVSETPYRFDVVRPEYLAENQNDSGGSKEDSAPEHRRMDQGPMSEREAQALVDAEKKRLQQYITDMARQERFRTSFKNLPPEFSSRLEPGQIVIDLSKIASPGDLLAAWRYQLRRWILELHNQRFLMAIRSFELMDMIPSMMSIHSLAQGFLRHVTSGEKVLELGAGHGNLALALSALGAHVTAIDISTQFLQLTRSNFKAAGLERPLLAGMEGLQLGFKGSVFDRVVSRQTLTGNPPWDRPAALREIYRVLKPGGGFDVMEFVRRAHETKAYSWEWTVLEWAEAVKQAGFVVKTVQPSDDSAMVVIHAEKPRGDKEDDPQDSPTAQESDPKAAPGIDRKAKSYLKRLALFARAA